MKAFADNKLNVTKMIISVFDRLENIVGKREIACKQFLLFPKCFQKASFPDPSKGVIMWEWVNCSCKDFKGFNPFPKETCNFTCVQYKAFENTVGKGEIAQNEQFLLLPQ